MDRILLCTHQRPKILKNIYDSKWGHPRSTEVTHVYQEWFHACRCKGLPHFRDVCRDILMTAHYLWLMEDYQ